MKYVESHHPSIKERVVKIISNHHCNNRNQKIILDRTNDEKLYSQTPSMNNQNHSIINFSSLKDVRDRKYKRTSQQLFDL
jgi:hypothetical protein